MKISKSIIITSCLRGFLYTAVLLLVLAAMACSSEPNDEVSGVDFDEYRELVNAKLGYDASTISHVKMRQAETGMLGAGAASTVILFERLFDFSSKYNTPALVVVSGNDIVCEDIYLDCYASEFSLADIDGDGCDEILMHHHTGGNGGFSSHETAVYKLDDGKLIKLFSYPAEDSDNISRWPDFDTGFTLTLSDGWTHTVENKYTGFSLTFKREMLYENPYFDLQGSFTGYNDYVGSGFGVDPFLYIFEPVDVDGDGVFEIKTAQYTYLWGRADSVGTAYTILKWNTNKSTMDVVKAGFWAYEEDFNNKEYLARWTDYEASWYENSIFYNISISPEQIMELVSDAAKKLHSSERLSATFRAYSKYEDRIYKTINEHRPSAGKWNFNLLELADMVGAFERLPECAFNDAWISTDEDYPCLVLSYMDEEPLHMPVEYVDYKVAGGINRHTFYLDIQERCLRSYWVSEVPFFLGDNGEIVPFAPSTTYYNVIDIDCEKCYR